MKDLFDRLTRYGVGWDLFFRVEENNSITMHLSYLDREKMKVYTDRHILSNVSRLYNGEIIHILDNMHQYVQKQIKK